MVRRMRTRREYAAAAQEEEEETPPWITRDKNRMQKLFKTKRVLNKSKLKVGFIRAYAARGDGSRKELLQIPRVKKFL